MRVRNAVLTALLAAAGVAVFADDAQALGRRRNRGSGNCCPGPAMVAPSSPCCGAAAGAPTFVGAAGIPGNVIVSGEAVPNPMPGVTTATTTGTTAVTTIPGTNLIPATNLPAGTITTSGTVIPARYYYSGAPGGIQVAGYPGTVYGYPAGSQTFQGGFQSGVVNSALGVPNYYYPGTTIGGAVGNYAGNAVGRGLFRRR